MSETLAINTDGVKVYALPIRRVSVFSSESSPCFYQWPYLVKSAVFSNFKTVVSSIMWPCYHDPCFIGLNLCPLLFFSAIICFFFFKLMLIFGIWMVYLPYNYWQNHTLGKRCFNLILLPFGFLLLSRKFKAIKLNKWPNR